MYLAFFWDIYAPTNILVKDIDSWASNVLQNYQTVLTSNMNYFVALGVGLKSPRKSI